jgi:hypothetical protein
MHICIILYFHFFLFFIHKPVAGEAALPHAGEAALGFIKIKKALQKQSYPFHFVFL